MALIIFLAFPLLQIVTAAITRRTTTEIAPHANTGFGSWGPVDLCPENSFAHGFQLKVEWNCFRNGTKDCDDTALNAIKLFCSYADGKSAGYVESFVGPFGSWGESTQCHGAGNWLSGAQFRSEPYQHSHGGDDTAGNNLNMACLDGEIREGVGEHWGSWSDWVRCPVSTAVCGIKNKVEGNCFKEEDHCDDTAHNAVVFYCCNLPVTTTPTPTTTIPHFSTVNLTLQTFNALDNNVLPMVSIMYFVGGNGSVQSASTGSTGQTMIPLSDINFPIYIRVNASKQGFISSENVFLVNNESPTAFFTISLTPELEPEQDFRLVMNWGHSPSDLDLHVLQFSNSNPNKSCETFYGNKHCDGLSLDVDNTSGGDNGAETITWTEPGDNWYILFVYDFSKDGTQLSDSGARLSFYAEDFTFTENIPETDPNTRSYYWVLGCFDGTNAADSFKLVNDLEEQYPDYDKTCQKISK